MESNSSYVQTLEATIGPTTSDDQAILETTTGFKYRNATGELIFAMITCHADIAFSVIKLTQYNIKATPCHYDALKLVFGTSKPPYPMESISGIHDQIQQCRVHHYLLWNRIIMLSTSLLNLKIQPPYMHIRTLTLLVIRKLENWSAVLL